MKKFRFTALLAAAVMCCAITVSCGKKEAADQNGQPEPPAEGVGELYTPDEGSEEADLGSYRLSPNGVKLYYEETEYPTELVLTLEKYFRSFAERDYQSYESTVFPNYVEEWNAFLEKEYEYGMETSFETQCDNLKVNAGGDFTITRIKLEKYDGEDTEEELIEGYFSYLDEILEKDYCSQVKEMSDDLHHAVFYVMAKGSDETETVLISGFEIVFAELDDKYYVFG